MPRPTAYDKPSTKTPAELQKEWGAYVTREWATNPELIAAAAQVRFGAMERDAIASVLEVIQINNSKPDAIDSIRPWRKFGDVASFEWLKYRSCGPVFVKKLRALGWVMDADRNAADSGPHLSIRAENILHNSNIFPNGPLSKEAVKEAITGGRLIVGRKGPRNYGAVIHREVCTWVGIAPPKENRRRWKFDPYTGKPLARS